MGSQAKLNRFRRERDLWTQAGGVAAAQYVPVEDADNRDEVGHAQLVARDRVIAMAGASRMSDVRFFTVRDKERAVELMGEGERAPGFLKGDLDDIVEYLDKNPTAGIVVAVCVVAQTPAKAGQS